jgi:hypothetical protein
VAAATLTGALYGVLFDATQDTPNAVLTINVAGNQAAPADYDPAMVFTSGSGYPQPLTIPIGLGGFFPLPPELQNLPAKIQLQVQNAGANVSVQLVTSA